VNDQPIGVFDSGIGGLTVVRELVRRLPHESLVYVGDTARVPYGTKSPETVRQYSAEILELLLARNVKMVVVACNTASAHALQMLRDMTPVPVEGVVDPGARAAVRATKTGRIGVIGTPGTVKSGAYERAIRALKPDAEVKSAACPLFVPLVEEGWLDHPATKLVVREYLEPMQRESIDTIVLGCTHYPLLKPLLAAELGGEIAIIDSAAETAAVVDTVLREKNLAAPAEAAGHVHYCVSDAVESFTRVGAAFLGDQVRDVEHVQLGAH